MAAMMNQTSLTQVAILCIAGVIGVALIYVREYKAAFARIPAPVARWHRRISYQGRHWRRRG